VTPGAPYAGLAAVWDLMGQDRHSARMVDYTLALMKRHRIRAVTGLDLCCGTGTALARFLDRGFIMAGLDGSPEMIAQAARKLRGRGVRLYQKTLPAFRLIPDDRPRGTVRVDFITCFYDSLNHLLTERDLGAAFRSVHDHLNDRGWFIFDMNTAAALSDIWSGHVFADAREELAWVWKSEYQARSRTACLTAATFVKRGDRWDRFDEIHYERAYSNTRIRQLLRSAGFTVRGFYDCYRFTPADRSTLRVCVVARRRT